MDKQAKKVDNRFQQHGKAAVKADSENREGSKAEERRDALEKASRSRGSKR